MHYSEAGKGGDQRPTDHNKFSSGYDLIWGKKEKRLADMTEADFNEALGIKTEENQCQKENPSA
jgi:hypothetical protein